MRSFQSISMRSFRPATTTRIARTPFSTNARCLATGDYGSGEGDPAGERPQEQGANPSADKEHPGPPPPSAARGGGKQSGTSGSQSQEQQKGSDLSSKNLKEGAQPKIHSESAPHHSDHSEDVKKHNREMDQRAERPTEKADESDREGDKVDKEFWKGKVPVLIMNRVDLR